DGLAQAGVAIRERGGEENSGEGVGEPAAAERSAISNGDGNCRGNECDEKEHAGDAEEGSDLEDGQVIALRVGEAAPVAVRKQRCGQGVYRDAEDGIDEDGPTGLVADDEAAGREDEEDPEPGLQGDDED